jgi:hypothetical protein
MRINLKTEDIGAFEILQKKTGLDLQSVFNEALTLYSWAIEKKEQGKGIASIDETNHTFSELRLPGLDKIQPHV